MRKSTLASMLILCGSTAALAQVATPHQHQPVRNNGNAMANEAMAPESGDAATPPAMDPTTNTTPPATDPTTRNTPTPR